MFTADKEREEDDVGGENGEEMEDGDFAEVEVEVKVAPMEPPGWNCRKSSAGPFPGSE